jgi:sugar-specific transcriptional regulator TrmB
LDTATRTFIISTPTLSEVRDTLSRRMEKALKRGVRATVITEPNQRVPEGVDTVRKRGLIATDIIADGERALIASPDLNACGYTDNASLAKHLENFIMILMEGQWES